MSSVSRSSLPAGNGFAITPNDNTDLQEVTRGLYVGASGNVVVHLRAMNSPITLTSMAAGVVHPLEVRRVLSTGTTATGLVGLV